MLATVLVGGALAGPAPAATMAVASSFAPMARDLAALPELRRTHLIAASSGTLYNQIARGAPYDLAVFADADWTARVLALRPGRRQGCLAEAAMAVWSPRPGLSPAQLRRLLTDPDNRIALPNPATAPAGRTALALLRHWQIDRRPDLILAGSAAHTLNLAQRGAVDLALLPLPLLLASKNRGSLATDDAGCCRLSYRAVLLNDGPEARRLFAVLRQPRIRDSLAAAGFELPGRDCQSDDAEPG